MKAGGRPLDRILDQARWAPSGDNRQTWRFEIIDDRHVVVHGFDTRHDCVYDLDGSASQIGLGALLETMRIAASVDGLRVEATRRMDSAVDTPVVDVRLEPDPTNRGRSAGVVHRDPNRQSTSARPSVAVIGRARCVDRIRRSGLRDRVARRTGSTHDCVAAVRQCAPAPHDAGGLPGPSRRHPMGCPIQSGSRTGSRGWIGSDDRPTDALGHEELAACPLLQSISRRNLGASHPAGLSSCDPLRDPLLPHCSQGLRHGRCLHRCRPGDAATVAHLREAGGCSSNPN